MTSRHGSIESFFLEGEAGKLEALLNFGVPNAQYACVVAHPHPLFGGTMHNKVVFHAMKALNSFGFPVLRFNFRGVGTSTGEHDYGRGEMSDVRVALDYVSQRYSLPIIFAGFSFGAAVGLRAVVEYLNVKALIGLGIPVNADGREYTYEALETSPLPKLLLSGARDQFAPAARLNEIFDATSEPKRLVLVPDADHFFAGHLDQLRAELSNWVREVVGALPIPAV